MAHVRLGGLDALRGAAVALVLLRHAFPETFPGAGIVGVAIFFTLSGYLITGIISREVERTGGLSFRRFYRNRALRLLPALGLLLAVYAAVGLLWNPMGQRDQVPLTTLVAVFYLADAPGLPPLSGMSHLWTLAVEEQFYLLWPTALILAVRRGQVGLLLAGAGALWLITCSLTLLLIPGGPEEVYRLPTSWAITMLVGAAAYCGRERLPRVRGAVAVAAGLLLAVLCLAPEAKGWALTYLLGAPLVAVAASAVVLYLAAGVPVPSLLAPLRWLGMVSYAAYLWNNLILSWLHEWVGYTWVTSAALIPATLVAAGVSWVLVEAPAQALKGRLDAPKAPGVIDLSGPTGGARGISPARGADEDSAGRRSVADEVAPRR